MAVDDFTEGWCYNVKPARSVVLDLTLFLSLTPTKLIAIRQQEPVASTGKLCPLGMDE